MQPDTDPPVRPSAQSLDRVSDDDRDVHALRRRLEGTLGIPATEGNRVDVLHNGDEIFPAMLAAVAASERSIDFLTFIYWRGEVAREFAYAFADRAREGVRVRVLLDAIGGRLMDRGLIRHMERAGVTVEWYRKPYLISPLKQNHRTHRKVLICDEQVGFTGGVGIAAEWTGDARNEDEWRDTHFRVQGPAVDGLSAAFAQNWAETGHPLFDERDIFPEHAEAGPTVVQVARGSASVGWNDMSTVFRVLIESAQRRLRICTAYFVPDPTFEELLCAAATRGVTVDLLVPGPHWDKRVSQIASESTYGRLTSGGIRVWSFQPSMLHAKVTTVDGIACVVGSANFNRRSMSHDEEVVLTLFDREITATLDGHFDDDLERSVRIDPDRWEDRSLPRKALQKSSTVIHRWL